MFPIVVTGEEVDRNGLVNPNLDLGIQSLYPDIMISRVRYWSQSFIVYIVAQVDDGRAVYIPSLLIRVHTASRTGFASDKVDPASPMRMMRWSTSSLEGSSVITGSPGRKYSLVWLQPVKMPRTSKDANDKLSIRRI